MKRSNASTLMSRPRSHFCSSVVSGLRKKPVSIFSRSHDRWRWLAMCSIS
jgi:hypothetical protein